MPMVAITHLDLAGMEATFSLRMRIRIMGTIICSMESTHPTPAAHATALEIVTVLTTATPHRATSITVALRPSLLFILWRWTLIINVACTYYVGS